MRQCTEHAQLAGQAQRKYVWYVMGIRSFKLCPCVELNHQNAQKKLLDSTNVCIELYWGVSAQITFFAEPWLFLVVGLEVGWEDTHPSVINEAQQLVRLSVRKPFVVLRQKNQSLSTTALNGLVWFFFSGNIIHLLTLNSVFAFIFHS